MDLRPWQLWSNERQARPRTRKKSLLAWKLGAASAYPNHVGANHFYIHAAGSLAASGARAAQRRASGERWSLRPGTWCTCRRTSTSAPATIPQAAAANQAAVKADRAYIERSGTQGSLYDMMYFSSQPAFPGDRVQHAGKLGLRDRQREPDRRACRARREADGDVGRLPDLAAIHAGALRAMG